MQGIDNDYFIFIYDSGIQRNIQVESRNSWGKKKICKEKEHCSININ